MHRRALFGLREPAAPAATASPLNVAAGLEPYVPSEAQPWDERRAAHLVRRTAFGNARADVVEALFRSPAEAVDFFVDRAAARPLPDAPDWADQLSNDGETNRERVYWLQEQWYAEMREGGLRERLALAWHDHFACEVQVYYQAAFAHEYLSHLRRHALGNFRAMVHGVGLLPAQLVYLDGVSNTAENPNENYGRELCELFTMGITDAHGTPNYTQDEVREIARALTGWTVTGTRAHFDAARHDAGPKTIFGRTGPWGYDDVLQIIFEERAAQTAHRVATRLYRAFVYDAPDAAVVQALADLILASDFELAPAVRALLKSAHFFDDAFVGARLKSPTELMVGLVRELGVADTPDVRARFRAGAHALGQDLLNPPNVAGWPGGHAWVTTGTVPERQALGAHALFGGGPFEQFDPLAWVGQISDETNVWAIPADVARHLLPVPIDAAGEDYLRELLLNGAPHYEWPEIVWNEPDTANERLRIMLAHLIGLPEFQLV